MATSPPRTPPRLERVFYHAPVYFITFCTYRRRRWLATHAEHAEFVRFARRAQEEHSIGVGRYVILPDHVHLFVAGSREFDLGRWVGMLKQSLGKAVMRPPSADPIWLRGSFDHLLRSWETYAQKWEYVRENPVRAGLAATAEAWPYAGEVVAIDRA